MNFHIGTPPLPGPPLMSIESRSPATAILNETETCSP